MPSKLPSAILVSVVALLAFAPASPAKAQLCLSPTEQRQEMAAGNAVSLAAAMRNLRPEHRGEVVNARLCRTSGDLVYLLTVVDRHGKVNRIRFDAATGRVIQVR